MTKKKTILITVIVLVLALALTAGTALAQEVDLVPLHIENQTEQNLFITLVGEDTFYGLPVGPNSSATFTVRRGFYEHSTFACGDSATGTVDMFRQLRLIFTPCAGVAPNEGAPSIEKVHLTDSPTGKLWQFQWGPRAALAQQMDVVSPQETDMVALQLEDTVPLHVENQTDQNVFITLVGEGTFYGLPVGPNSSRTFTVRRGLYDHSTFACGDSATGSVDMFRQLRLIFTPCAGTAPNEGAPSTEKVHLTDSPTGKLWQFQWD